MKAIAKLFSLNTPACDGSIIPTRVFEEYLSSPMYKETMEDHTALGAITHYNRKPHSDEKGVIGKDDIATAVRKYIFEKNNNSCQICGWHEVNPYTGLIPL